ncbi:MAG: oxygen-dependent protoporphyrinogen oxidase [Candidatus Krumholzibacteriia bacterium]
MRSLATPDLTGLPTEGVAIIGGGVAGLATALNLRDSDSDLEVTLFEKDPTCGGNLRTQAENGWQIEYGPNGYLDNEPAMARLIERLKLDDAVTPSNESAKKRFLMVNGEMVPIPTSPPAFLKSKMLPMTAKLRIAGEFFVPRRAGLGKAADIPAGDETVAAFGRRRLGKAFTETMLDPMVKGISGGDAENLSLAAAFPRMVEMEQEFGGLFKALIKKRKGDGSPTGVLHTFEGGMARLVLALKNELEQDPSVSLQTGASTQSVTHTEEGWFVTTTESKHGPFSAVVAAAPAHAAAKQIADLDQVLASTLAEIPFAPMAVIALGFPRANVGHNLDGFGMLVPSKEKRRLLGMLWTSSIFPGRAPQDQVLIRAMAGGATDPAVMEMDDESLTKLALDEIRPLLQLSGEPTIVKVIRHEKAIAQYTPGHLARMKAIDSMRGQWPGLFFTGSSYRGIAVNACVKDAEKVAAEVIANLNARKSQAAEVT